MAAQEGAAGTANQVARVRYGDVDDSNFALRGRAVPLLAGLLALLVAFVAVCLYLRWACGRRRARRDADREASSSSAAASPVPGLDADAINGLPVTLYSPPASSPARSPSRQKGDGGDEEQAAAAVECSICISALVPGDKVKALPPCGHCFHPECVDAWLRSQPSCPLCRTLLLPAAAVAKRVDVVNGGHPPPV
uniref:RING-type E3 ubiquitin transferase n=1 Tax=Aegilops tauschii subsp. strangulata TaxID=200361 RepID=A0A452ZBY1_AEGTS